MTSDFELREKIKDLKIKASFRGVFMRNELKNLKRKNNECGIINLNGNDVSPEFNSKTGHWQAWFVKKKNYFFCSFGAPCPKEMIEYLGKPILISNFQIQDFSTQICGEICCLFIHFMDSGMSYVDTVLTLYKMFQEEKEEKEEEKHQNG